MGTITNVTTGTLTITTSTNTSAQNTQIVVDTFNAAAQTAGADIRASAFETGTAGAYGIRLDSGNDFAITTQTLVAGLADTDAGLTNNFSTIDVTTQDSAEKAIITSDYVLRDLDKTRSDIGSVQNQLESTIRNISVTQVNVSAAESQIRDVDFAAESANFAKLNILAQSGSYALSQAYIIPQNILKLLQ